MQPQAVELALTEFNRKVVEEAERQIEEAARKRSGKKNVESQIRQAEAAIRNVLDSLQDCPKSKSLLAELNRLEEKLDVLQSTEETVTIAPMIPTFDEKLIPETRNGVPVIRVRGSLRLNSMAGEVTPSGSRSS
jgi:hypothetical protein